MNNPNLSTPSNTTGKTYLELDEVTLLETSANNLRDRLLIRFLFRLGARVSEALGVIESNIDFENSTIIIEHLKLRTQSYCPQCNARLTKRSTYCSVCGSKVEEIVAQEKKHRRQRVLPIDGDTLKMLGEYIQRGGLVTRGGKRLIFGINRHRAWQVIKECADKAGLPKLLNPETGMIHNISPHRLRDAFAVYAIKQNDSGDGLRLLQVHLGHQSFDTTARYRKVSGTEAREWYQGLWAKKSQ